MTEYLKSTHPDILHDEDLAPLMALTDAAAVRAARRKGNCPPSSKLGARRVTHREVFERWLRERTHADA